MRLLILLSLFFLLSSFGRKSKIISWCHFDVNSSVIFPIENDSSIYLERYFSSKGDYLIESIYSNGKEIYKTEMRGYNKGRNCVVTFDDFHSENIFSQSSSVTWPNSRTFNLKKDSATFKIWYFKNGSIAQCELAYHNPNQHNSVFYFDSLNTNFWTGAFLYSGVRIDTTYSEYSDGEYEGTEMRIYRTDLIDSIGTWYKYSCNNERVDSAHCKIIKTKNILRKKW